jgi:flagellar basal body-associated protein FliL
MEEKSITNQRGIGGILIIAAVVFVIIAIAVMAYFLLRGNNAQDAANSENGQTETSETIITDDQVPLKICETGDPEECNDPVSNSDVDNITNIEED